MSRFKVLIVRLYRLLLLCYPPGFRDEFCGEMEKTFRSMVLASGIGNDQSTWRIVLREVIKWPGSVLSEHLRERRKLILMNENPLRPAEWVAAMIVFLLPTFFPLINLLQMLGLNLPGWVDNILGIFVLAVFAAGVVSAFAKGFQRWTLPYLGLVLVAGVFLIGLGRIYGPLKQGFTNLFGVRWTWGLGVRAAYNGSFSLYYLLIIFCLGVLLITLLRLLPFSRKLWRYIRADWTQFSFLIYGSLIFSVILEFDEYRYSEFFMFWASVSLAVGAWFYLTADTKRERILTLLGGASFAFVIISLGKWILVPFQNWTEGYPASASMTSYWVETSSAVFSWIGAVIILLLPALVDFLPGKSSQNNTRVEGIASS